MKKLIVVADWVQDSLTCQEFKTATEGFLKNSDTIDIDFVSSTPSTIHTGFLINQMVTTTERYGLPQELIIFANTDPRLKESELEKTKGAELVIIRLISGIYLIGPNAEYNFSFIKNQIDEIYRYPGFNEGNQFRSRDSFSRVTAHLIDEMEDELEMEEISKDIIPEIKGFYIGHIDNFGNIKTTIKHEDLKGRYELGDIVKVKINNIEEKAKYTNSLFGGRVSELVIYPGSSGDKDNPFLEISAWQHFNEGTAKTGKDFFNNPSPGMKLEI
jgi:hypothetical protein